jgi:hypothetical protein
MPVTNALFVVDAELLERLHATKGEHLSILSPELSGQSKLAFQFDFLKIFFYPEFLQAYVHFLTSKQTTRTTKNSWKFFDQHPTQYFVASNELWDTGQDEAILSNRNHFIYQKKTCFIKGLAFSTMVLQ